MNPNWILRALLWFFPHAFSQRFGEEWMSLSEDLLGTAHSRGGNHPAKAWVALVLDTFFQAPKAHAQQAWSALVGTPPELAGLGWSDKTLVLARHWAWRPLAASANQIHNHLFFGILGAFVMTGSYRYFSLRSGWAFTDYFPLREHDIWVKTLLYWPSVALLLCLMALLVSPYKAFKRWRSQGNRLVVPMFMFLLGFSLTTHVLVVQDMETVSSQAGNLLSDYATGRDLPVAYPNAQQPWSVEQRRWFEPDAMGDPVVRPSMHAAWCDVRKQVVDQQANRILASPDSATSLRAVLWISMLAQATENACYTPAEMLSKQTAIWGLLRNNPDPNQQVWERYEATSFVLRVTSSSYYLTQAKVVPDVKSYCQVAAISQYNQMKGSSINIESLESFCENLQWKMRPDQARDPQWPTSPLALFPIAKQHYLSLTPVTTTELMEVEKVVAENSSVWVRPKKDVISSAESSGSRATGAKH